MPAHLDHQSSDARRLLIVTGSGRSGTSTAAGTLRHLGFHLPEPQIPPTSANPRGFFEPQWVVDFHRRMLRRVSGHTMDARPDALARAARVASHPARRRELTAWLSSLTSYERLAVKDPRAFWFADLWIDSCADVGLVPAFLTMLRHPTEVVASRDIHFAAQRVPESRRQRETTNLAAWVNVALASERVTRGRPRAFVEYDDLISDWRTATTRAADQLQIRLDTDLSADVAHPVDDFIDQDLRRASRAWEDLSVPTDLRDIAEQTWPALQRLTVDPADEWSLGRLDELRTAYDALHAQAVGLTLHHTLSEMARARQVVRRRARRRRRRSESSGEGARSRGLADVVGSQISRLRTR